MINNKIKRLIFTGIAALVSSCDTPGRVELAERTYEGKVTIKMVRQVRVVDFDTCRLEVIDSNGNGLADFGGACNKFYGKLYTKDGIYDINSIENEGIRKKVNQ